MPSMCRRGDLQDLAERLDREGIAMLVDEVPQDLSRRSSSAWAKTRSPTPQGLAGRDAFAHAAVNLDALDPFAQRLRHASNLRRDGLNGRPQRRGTPHGAPAPSSLRARAPQVNLFDLLMAQIL
jgi:hypothetical protein